MKKLLEEELKTLALEILQGNAQTNVDELKATAADLYEKLSVLSYSQKHAKKEVPQPVAVATQHSKEEDERYSPDGMQYNPEAITEPNTEKIKDIVAEMPEEGSPEEIWSEKKEKPEEDWRNMGVHYDDLPQFEPKNGTSEAEKKNEQTENPEANKETPPTEFTKKSKLHSSPQKKSLNDRLKRGISFGLNDRLVYIKHLFAGNAPDFDRVLSQLNTFESYEGAKRFIETVVKPDYNHWSGEEIYEQRFLKAIESKMV